MDDSIDHRGTILYDAEVLTSDSLHYYLEHPECPRGLVVLPLTRVKRPLFIGERVNVTITKIQLFGEEVPGCTLYVSM
jgi:hypothetical protein